MSAQMQLCLWITLIKLGTSSIIIYIFIVILVFEIIFLQWVYWLSLPTRMLVPLHIPICYMSKYCAWDLENFFKWMNEWMQSWGYSLESLWSVLFIEKLTANYLGN